jgi:hypothetical protein
MSTEWSISKLTSGETPPTEYLINVEKLSYQISRQPLVSPLPGNATTGETTVLIVDMGMTTRQINVTGIVDLESEESDDGTFCSKLQLEDASLTWWAQMQWGSGAGLTILTTPEGTGYKGVIRNASFTLNGGTNYYEFSIDFIVHSRVDT